MGGTAKTIYANAIDPTWRYERGCLIGEFRVRSAVPKTFVSIMRHPHLDLRCLKSAVSRCDTPPERCIWIMSGFKDNALEISLRPSITGMPRFMHSSFAGPPCSRAHIRTSMPAVLAIVAQLTRYRGVPR